MKTKFKSEAKIGLIVIAAFAVFVWGLNYLKGVNLLNPSNHYYVNYTQIDGLVKSSPVMLDGYQVGLVRDIQYQYDQPGHIIIDLDLNTELKLPEGSKAIIQSAMVGNPTVVLKLGELNGKVLNSGDTLLSGRNPGIMDQLQEGVLADVQRMIQRTDSLLASVETLVNNGSLNHSLTSIEKTSKELSLLSVKLNKSMDKLPSILDNVDEMTAQFSAAGTKINQIDVTSLNKTLNQLENITLKLNSTDNSMGLLLNDKALYQNLSAATFNLSTTASSANALLLDLKASPKRYVHFSLFGSK
ncbi:MAG TPA: MlaD family protein [Bacteroidales bacterium]|nr:MlaD family protein [Bacteroidales bacterium]